VVAAKRPKQGELPKSLDAFAGDAQIQRLGKRQNGPHDGLALPLPFQVHHEGAIHFQRVNRQGA